MNEFKKIFIKVNGFKILREYARAHVMIFSLICTVLMGMDKKSLELVRMSVSNKIVKKLRKKYRSFIYEYLDKEKNKRPLEHKSSKKVWVCWLQGMDYAPDVVKICYNSLITNLAGYEIILITNENYKDYVNFPDYIQNKIDKKIIGPAHLSDLIRLELLEHYGGTWIDATVYCSGGEIPNYLMDSYLFMYQIMKPGRDGHSARTSNWFISSYTNNHILMLTKALLYEYWRKNNYAIDYFIFHDFMELSIETYKEEWEMVIPVSSSIPHILQLRFGKKFNKKEWDYIKKMTPFHKLTYKISENEYLEYEKEGTYFNELIIQGDGDGITKMGQ